ncbi:hypothetical protein ORI89_09405 [Sphingobacterium sp. UT-1RO-CII-1]|uniref:hypothetical protein n=1 Tax=Sphingobacterium sp. UT-1RO-CII-1 TaxID=2995225 RepID=UPI00227D0B12|nr:hypothetical protein [Sphingobacterium sp. UT-1RO-CII-1]MCY4779868.1 hypothetical protein [Sphingobacterium sp. UT-1RO-CII-1]
MKKINFEEMEKISAQGDGQDFVSGILCGLAIGATVASGGTGLAIAVVGCGVLFGDW